MRNNIISYLNLEWDFSRSQQPNASSTLSDQRHKISGEKFYVAAASFAGRLYDKGIWNQPIVVKAGHRLETLVLFLGAVLSGNYYVPLAEDLPEEKVQKILGVLHTGRVYTYDDIRYTEGFPAQDLLEGLQEVRGRLPEDAVLYIVFTSGTTGEPKGIVKSHRSMAAFLECYSKVFTFSEEDVIANQTPFCFDASAKDFYLMLQYRMDFHIVDGAMFFRPLELVKLLNEWRVTLIQWVPSALSMLSQFKAFEKEGPRYLQKVFFVGETFPVRQLKYWQEHLPDTMFVNLYGASEMAGVCCCFVLPDSWQGDDIPIGKPLPGQKVYLMDGAEVITRPGIAGEVYVESATLAEGYLELQGQSEGRFMPGLVRLAEEVQGESCYCIGSMVSECRGCYHTGDLARYDEEGNLYFVCRRDFQIKHMGHRIELGEIERAAEGMEGVERSGVIYQKGKIWLYYQGQVERQELQAYLKQSLQPYMMPHKIVALETLPLNKNGKVDRMALQKIRNWKITGR